MNFEIDYCKRVKPSILLPLLIELHILSIQLFSQELLLQTVERSLVVLCSIVLNSFHYV